MKDRSCLRAKRWKRLRLEEINMIELKHFSDEHAALLRSFELPEKQEQFTSLPKNNMVALEGRYRIIILNDNEPVGFFLLHASTSRVKEYSDNLSAILLTSLSINRSNQGKGYAKQAMNKLKRFVSEEFTDCNEIILAVNHKNMAAQKLYEKVGFQDTGRRKTGPIGEQYILNILL